MQRIIPIIGLCGLIIASSGCSLWSKSAKPTDNSWSITKLWKKDYQQPQSLAIIWSPDTLTVAGQPTTRGFGGRVFFYDEITRAVPVEGDLIIHGYRNQPILGQSDHVRADKTFAFTAAQLTAHFSPSQLGASYSIWIPWDTADGFREEVTLIPTFKAKNGSIVQGAPTKLYLPGRSLGVAADRSSQTPAQTVSYQQTTIATNPGIPLPNANRQMLPTTIDVPPSASLNRPRIDMGREISGSELPASKRPPSATAVTVGGSQQSAFRTQEQSDEVKKSSFLLQ